MEIWSKSAQKSLSQLPSSSSSGENKRKQVIVEENEQVGEKEKIKSADPSKTFESFGLTQLMVQRIRNQIGLGKPTKVQSACIPPLVRGLNCIAQAPTGTGKTLAFGIPIVSKWALDPFGVFALVLTPTRELAIQIKEQLAFLGGERAKVALVIGGVDFQTQALELFSKPSFVVATPGRLLDHLQSDESSFLSTFSNCKYLVYDEADKLLDGQFDAALDQISASVCPKKRKQVAFFSATMLARKREEMIQKVQLISHCSDQPFIYDYQEEEEEEPEEEEQEQLISPSVPLLSKIPLTQKYILCPKDFKDGYLMELLRSIRDKEVKVLKNFDIRSMIIFAATIRETQVLSLLLANLGFENATLHSHLDQKARAKALSDFRSSRVNCLVATDVVSRGLDIRTVDLVVNYSIPMPPDYVHRVGRTGRAGQRGLAITFVVPLRDVKFLKNVEKYIGEELNEMKIDEGKVLKILTDVQANRKIADLAVEENDPFEERAKINKQKREMEAVIEGKPLPKKKKKKIKT